MMTYNNFYTFSNFFIYYIFNLRKLFCCQCFIMTKIKSQFFRIN